jgi:UDP-N-acetylmuramate dehydrogenase
MMDTIMVDDKLRESLRTEISGAQIRYDESMTYYTSLHMGGPADVLITPPDIKSLSQALEIMRRLGLPSLPIGGGTNLLVRDGGIEGAVLSMNDLKGLETTSEDGGGVDLRVEAGLPLQHLVGFSKKMGLRGVEGLAGIPGTVGGAVSGNSGAFGYEMKDVIKDVTLIEDGWNVKIRKKEQIAFRYRSADLKRDDVVVAADIRLLKDSPEAVAERIEGFLKEKKATQPLGQRTAGCVFKNPPEEAAGRLIEQAGFKGIRVGDIEVSPVHANFFVNRGEGSAEDFLRLMEKVAKKVKTDFGIVLEPEIKIVGRL